MSILGPILAALFPSAPRHIRQQMPPQLPEVTVFRSDDLTAAEWEEMRDVPICQWHNAIRAKHEAERLTDTALAQHLEEWSK